MEIPSAGNLTSTLFPVKRNLNADQLATRAADHRGLRSIRDRADGVPHRAGSPKTLWNTANIPVE